jgi:hypothetical protein
MSQNMAKSGVKKGMIRRQVEEKPELEHLGLYSKAKRSHQSGELYDWVCVLVRSFWLEKGTHK